MLFRKQDVNEVISTFDFSLASELRVLKYERDLLNEALLSLPASSAVKNEINTLEKWQGILANETLSDDQKQHHLSDFKTYYLKWKNIEDNNFDFNEALKQFNFNEKFSIAKGNDFEIQKLEILRNKNRDEIDYLEHLISKQKVNITIDGNQEDADQFLIALLEISNLHYFDFSNYFNITTKLSSKSTFEVVIDATQKNMDDVKQTLAAFKKVNHLGKKITIHLETRVDTNEEAFKASIDNFLNQENSALDNTEQTKAFIKMKPLVTNRDIDQTLKRLRNEIQNFYPESLMYYRSMTDVYDEKNTPQAINYFKQNPRALFLHEKLSFLETKIENKTAILEKLRNHRELHGILRKEKQVTEKEKDENNSQPNNKFFHRLKKFFFAFINAVKKLIDLGDDTWAIIRNKLPPGSTFTKPSFSAGIIGSVGIFIHLGETIKSTLITHKAYQDVDNEKGQRKTRLITGGASSIIGVTGVAICLSLIAAGLGASIAGSAILGIMMPAGLTLIYALALVRSGYILHRLRQAETYARKIYEGALETAEPEMTKLNLAIKEDQKKLSSISDPKEYLTIKKQIIEKQSTLASFEAEIEAKKESYEFIRERHLKQEKIVAFGTLEVATQILVTIGIALGVAVLLGASIAAPALIPLTLICIGVGIATICKILEPIDDALDGSITGKIRKSWFGLGKKIKHFFSGKKEEKVTELDVISTPASHQKSSAPPLSTHASIQLIMQDNNSPRLSHRTSIIPERDLHHGKKTPSYVNNPHTLTPSSGSSIAAASVEIASTTLDIARSITQLI